jgi:sugar phosphate permease
MRGRYGILAILTFAYFVNYLDRGAISVAIPFMAKDLSLNHTEMGLVMSAFFVGFVLLELPAGWLSDKMGSRALVTLGILWWSVFTFLTGVARSLGGLVATRAIFGLGEGIYPPTSLKAVSQWFTERERALANGIMLAATELGLAAVTYFGVTVIAQWGWRALFYAIAAPGVLAALLILLFYRDTGVRAQRPAPLGNLLAQPVIWMWALGWFFVFVAFWGFSSWLPTFLLEVRHMPLRLMGTLVAETRIFGIGGMLIGGFVSDRLRKRAYTIVPALLLAAVCLGAGFLLPETWAILLGFGLTNLCIAAVPSAFYSLPMDNLPPERVGAALGFINAVGMISGIVAPLLVGVLVDLTGSYGGGILLMVGSVVVAAVPVLVAGERPLLHLPEDHSDSLAGSTG